MNCNLLLQLLLASEFCIGDSEHSHGSYTHAIFIGRVSASLGLNFVAQSTHDQQHCKKSIGIVV